MLPLIGFFTGGLFAKVVTFVLASYTVRRVSAVGFAVVTYTGIDLLNGQLENAINTKLGGSSSDMLSMFNLFGFCFVIQAMQSAFRPSLPSRGCNRSSGGYCVIAIIVGVPGAGKTLYTMSKLREEYQDREVYFHNVPGVTVDAWKEVQDPYKWHEKPTDLVIIVDEVDEAHEAFPQRDYKVKEPEHIEAAATLRHRGHDLVLITQHPVDLDIFLRRRCARFLFIKKPLSKGDCANVFVWGAYNKDYQNSREQDKGVG